MTPVNRLQNDIVLINRKTTVFCLNAFCLLLLSGLSYAENLDLQPDPELSPQQVVLFQLKALQSASDEGIAATFRFASPANRKITGPLQRFSRLFESSQYQPMISHKSADIKLINSDDQTAELQASLIDDAGNIHKYRFRLSKQKTAPFIDCWMTDAVIAVPHSDRSA